MSKRPLEDETRPRGRSKKLRLDDSAPQTNSGFDDTAVRILTAENRALMAENRVLEIQKDAQMKIHLAQSRAQTSMHAADSLCQKMVSEAQRKIQAAEKRAVEAEQRLLEMESKTWHKADLHLQEQEKRSVERRVSDATEDQPLRAPKRRKHFPWLNFTKKVWEIPEDIWGVVLTFMNDKELFRCRVLGTVSYGAYYAQRGGTRFNAMRAIRLARKGRVFPNVRSLHPAFSFLREDLQAISPKAFPELKSLSFYPNLSHRVALSSLPHHPRVTYLSVHPKTGDEMQHLTEKYPNLRNLRIRLGLNALSERLTELPPHAKLRSINVSYARRFLGGHMNYVADDFRWDLFTQERFPSLTKLVVKTKTQLPVPELTQMFLQRGIALIVVIELN